MRLVIRRLGKAFALVAVMASVVNANCTLSCSFQQLLSGALHPMEITQSAHTGHTCCPGTEKPEPAKEIPHQPCSDPLLTGGALSFADAPHVTASVQGLDFAPAQRLDE